MKTAASVSDALSKWGIRTFAGPKRRHRPAQKHRRAIGYPESDRSSDHPADDGQGCR
jgi:hypothetical protein